jgi:hypothetical protein
MKHGAIAHHRRLITKFVAMAMFFFLVPQAITYVLSSRSTSAMLLETLRVSLEEKSFLAGADIDRFFLQRERDARVLSQADVLEGDDLDAVIQYLTEITKETRTWTTSTSPTPRGSSLPAPGRRTKEASLSLPSIRAWMPSSARCSPLTRVRCSSRMCST